MPVYALKDDIRTDVFKNVKAADPQAIGEELERIAAANGGLVTPTSVIDSARNTDSSLHKHFDWKNAEAAHQWRLHQARHLVSAIRIVADDNGHSVSRAYVSIHADGVTAYHSVGDVLRNTSLQELLLKQADRELAAFQRRYSELADICGIVAEARQRISERQVQQRNASQPHEAGVAA